jgi:cysteinyl-tRNA synthetase
VRNITDIDDKIIRRAQENGESVDALTARFIGYMDEDAAALGVEKPDHEPRATQFVQPMVDMIGRLEEKNLAYQSSSGDVNYAVRRFPGYGKLSGKSLDELSASTSTSRKRTRSTSCCGSAPSRASRLGVRRGARGDRVGTSSARR